MTEEYSAGLMSQSFWFTEFKQYLKLIKAGKSDDEIKNEIVQENLFGAPNEYRAKRIYGYLRNRASTVDQEALEMFFFADLSTQKLFNLVCILRQDRLFFEFLYEVYREKVIMGDRQINNSDAVIFYNSKETQRDELAKWTDSTKKRVQACYFTFMAEANLIRVEDKQRFITPPILDISLENYLQSHGEESIAKAISGVY